VHFLSLRSFLFVALIVAAVKSSRASYPYKRLVYKPLPHQQPQPTTTMSPLPTTNTPLAPTQPTSSSLHRRWSKCSYYDVACSTHRNVLLGIIIVVCILTAIILALLFMRHHKRRGVERRTLQSQQTATMSQMGYNYGGTNPSPYYSAAGGADVGVEAPPPAYTRQGKDGEVVR